MKKSAKILTAVASAAVIAAAVTATVVVTSADDGLTEQEKIQAVHKELNAPYELQSGKYYYNGDKDSGTYFEVSDGGHIQCVIEDYEKIKPVVAQFVTPENTGLTGEEYEHTLKSNAYVFADLGATTYAVKCIDLGEGMTVKIMLEAEPYSNYEPAGSGLYISYIDEKTLEGAFGMRYILA